MGDREAEEIKKPKWGHVALAALTGLVFGLAVQWLVFKKELWWWNTPATAEVERVEAEDLQRLLDVLAEYGLEIEEALRVLGYPTKEE